MARIGIVISSISFTGGAEHVALNIARKLKPFYDIELIDLFSEKPEPPEEIPVRFCCLKKPESFLHVLAAKIGNTLKIRNIVKGFDIIIGNNFFRYYALPFLLPGNIIKVEIHHFSYFEEMTTSGLKKHISHLLRNFVYSRLDKLIVLTRRAEKDFNDNGVKNTACIPNGVDLKPSVVPAVTAKRIIAAGRLTLQKGFDILLRIWADVSIMYPEWKLDIFGEGPERDNLEELISSLHIKTSAALKGLSDNISDELSDSSICAFPSRYEGFPLVLLEAMSIGIPCVAFDCMTGPREIINDSHDGFLVPAGNIGMFKQRLCVLIEDEELRKQFSGNAKKSIGQYSWDMIMSLWKNVIDTLLEKK